MQNNNLSLDQLANKYNTDKGSEYHGPTKHGYAPFYDELLSKWRNDKIRMLEVGICMENTEGGHSIYMWNDYFNNASIFTFDIVDMQNHPSVSDNDNVFFYRGNQGNRNDFVSMYEQFGSLDFDFILEDGSHTVEHQMISLGHLFKYVKSDGYYILEDVSIPGKKVCSGCPVNDETYFAITNFMETNKIVSDYMTSEEISYIEKNVKKIEMKNDVQDMYVTFIFHKK